MPRPHFSVASLMVLVCGVAIAFVSLLFASELWAGTVFLLTLGTLTVAILAIVYRRGARRAFWFGFALLGWGYMALAWGGWRDGLVTSATLDALFTILPVPDDSPTFSASFSQPIFDPDPRNRVIHRKLEEPISMSFANETPLEDVLKYIRSATQGALDSGIPIYVDPVGLHGLTSTSPVKLDLEGVPLRTTLRLMLEQLGLIYVVHDGLLTITARNSGAERLEQFRRIGHCYWALLAGCLGGIAGRYLHVTRDSTPAV